MRSIGVLMPLHASQAFYLFMQSRKFGSSLLLAVIVFCSYLSHAKTGTEDQPAVVSAVAPVYAPVIRALNIQGDFFVDVEIDRNGKVISSESVDEKRSLMRKILEEAADRWTFVPSAHGIQRRKVRLTFTFRSNTKASNFDSTTVYYPPYKIEVRDNTEILNTPSH